MNARTCTANRLSRAALKLRGSHALGRRDLHRRARARANLGVADEQFLLAAVGRHEYQKGFDVLLRAFNEVHRVRPAARLVVAGPEGNATAALRGEIRESQLGN